MFCVYFCVCGRQKPEDPQIEPMAEDAITQGGLGGMDLWCTYMYLRVVCVMFILKFPSWQQQSYSHIVHVYWYTAFAFVHICHVYKF